MTSTFKRLGQSELLPRYIFAESLVARRRVLEIGAVASTLGQSARFLSTRGARIVVAADNDLAAVQEAQARLSSPTLRFRAAVFDDFESGSFDLVIVSDLAPYVRAPELMKEIARLVAKSGYLMGGLRNPAGLALSNVLEADETDVPPTYGQLLDLLSSFFKSVDVATQSPVLGYQLAFERGEGLQVDGSLAGLSEAAYYVVLAGHEEVRNFDPTWVQLPPEPLAFTGGRLEDASNRARDWRDRTEKLKEILERKTAELKLRETDLHENSQQLEAAKDAVSRLTAQLESVRERPEVQRDREDLATRVRQMEAELQVARERAIDAEGRVTAARNELEAIARQQKDAAVTNLAAQEGVRLERARREEIATQLEDSRLRLAKSYEELRRVQGEAGSERVEHERTKIAIERLKESVGGREKELQEARDRELRLAEARTDALKAIENLEAGFADVRRQLAEARDLVDRKEADRLSSVRSLDVEKQVRHGVEAELERERAQAVQLATDLKQRTTERVGAETEASALKASLERLEHELSQARASEDRWRQATSEHELRFSDTATELQRASARLVELERQLGNTDQSAQQLREELGVTRARVAELEDLLRVSRQNAERLTELVEADRIRLAELEGRLSTTADERAQLTESLAEVETQLVATTAQAAERAAALAAAEHRAKELDQALGLAESKIRELTDDRDALLVERDDLRGSLADVEKVRVEQVSRLGEVSELAASLSTRLSQVEGELAGARSALDRTSQDAGAQERALKSLLDERERDLIGERESRAATRRTLDEERDTRLSLEATHATTLRSLEESSRAIEEAKLELASLREERELTRAQLDAAQKSLSQTTDSKDLLDLERIDLEKRYRTLEADAKLAADRATDLETQVRGLLGELREAEQRAAAEKDTLENKLEFSAGELEKSQRAGAETAQELASLRAEFEALTASFTDLRGNLGETSGRTARLEAAANDLTTQLATAQAATADREERLEKLSAELATSAQTIARLESSLSALQGALESSREELSATKSTLAAAQTALESATVELAVKREAVTNLEVAVSEQRARATAAESARDERKAQVERLEGILRERDEGLGATSANLLKLEEEKTLLSQSLANAMSEAEHARLELEEALSARAIERELREKGELDLANLGTSSAATRADLESRLTTLTQELDWLRTEKTQLTDALTTARAELEAAGRTKVDLHAEVEATRQASRRALDEKHAEGEGKLQAQRDEHQRSLDQQAAAYQASLEVHRAEAHKALQAREEELGRQLVSSEARGAELEKQRLALQGALELATASAEQAERKSTEQLEASNKLYLEARASIDRALSEARGHQSGKQAMQHELDTLRTSLTQVGGESRAATEARAQLEAEVARLRQRIPELESELAQLKGLQPELSQLRSRLPEAEGALAAAQGQVTTLATSERELKKQVLDFDLALAQARARAAELEGAQVDNSSTRVELEVELKSLRDRINLAEAEATRLREARLTDDEFNAELRNRNTLLEAQLAELGRAAPQSDEEVAQVRRRLPELEAELDIARVSARHDVDTAQAARKQAEELLLALRVKYGDLQHQVTTASEDLAEARAENELLDSERERLAHQVETLETQKGRISVLEAELQSLRSAPARPSRPVIPPLVEKPVEVFELDVEADADDDAEEIVLLEDEATEPGKKDPRKPG